MSDSSRLLRVRIHFPVAPEEEPAPQLSAWERRWRREMVYTAGMRWLRGGIPVAIGAVMAITVGVIVGDDPVRPAVAAAPAEVAGAEVAPKVEPKATIAPKAAPVIAAAARAEQREGATLSRADRETPRARHLGTDGGVARLQLTSAIRGREPVDALGPLVPARTQRLYCFTEVLDMQGQTVIHRWEHDGRVMARLRFPIKGHRWRIFSSKALGQTLQGRWRVVVTDERGRVLGKKAFIYRGSRVARASSGSRNRT